MGERWYVAKPLNHLSNGNEPGLCCLGFFKVVTDPYSLVLAVVPCTLTDHYKTASLHLLDTCIINSFTPKLKDQLDLYDLTLDDVGVQFIQSNEYYNCEEPIILSYSMEDDEVMNCFVGFTHV